MVEKLVYSLEEVGELTGFGVRPLWNDCRAGRFAYVRRGNVTGMTLEQIQAVIAAHTIPPTAVPADAEAAEDAAIVARLQRKATRKDAA